MSNWFLPNTSYYAEFVTSDPYTKAAADADSLPAATATKNGTDDGAFSLTVTKIDTGRYKITGTVPADYAHGDRVDVSVAATVSSIAGKAVVNSFVVVSAARGCSGSDLSAAKTAAVAMNDLWKDGGNLNNALDQVAADVAGLNGDEMRGTENALLSASFIVPPSITDIRDANQFTGVFSVAVLVNAPHDSYVVSPVSISSPSGEASAHAPLVAYQYATLNYTLTIRDSQTGTARNLTGKSLRLQFFSKNDPETELFAITTDGEAGNRLVIGGDDSNVVTVEGPATITADARQMDWRLFNMTDMRVEGESIITIKPGPPIT